MKCAFKTPDTVIASRVVTAAKQSSVVDTLLPDRHCASRFAMTSVVFLTMFLTMGVAGLVLAAEPVAAKTAESSQVVTSYTEMAPPLMVVVNKSTILRLEIAATRISVANPAVADITPINPREIYVLGKTIGNTNLIIWNKNGTATMMDVRVTPEPVAAIPAVTPAKRDSVEVIKGLSKSEMEF